MSDSVVNPAIGAETSEASQETLDQSITPTTEAPNGVLQPTSVIHDNAAVAQSQPNPTVDGAVTVEQQEPLLGEKRHTVADSVDCQSAVGINGAVMAFEPMGKSLERGRHLGAKDGKIVSSSRRGEIGVTLKWDSDKCANRMLETALNSALVNQSLSARKGNQLPQTEQERELNSMRSALERRLQASKPSQELRRSSMLTSVEGSMMQTEDLEERPLAEVPSGDLDERPQTEGRPQGDTPDASGSKQKKFGYLLEQFGPARPKPAKTARGSKAAKTVRERTAVETSTRKRSERSIASGEVTTSPAIVTSNRFAALLEDDMEVSETDVGGSTGSGQKDAVSTLRDQFEWISKEKQRLTEETATELAKLTKPLTDQWKEFQKEIDLRAKQFRDSVAEINDKLNESLQLQNDRLNAMHQDTFIKLQGLKATALGAKTAEEVAVLEGMALRPPLASQTGGHPCADPKSGAVSKGYREEDAGVLDPGTSGAKTKKKKTKPEAAKPAAAQRRTLPAKRKRTNLEDVLLAQQIQLPNGFTLN